MALQVSAGNTLALQVDSEGQVRYDVIATRGHREGTSVQATFKDTVPMALRTDVEKSDMDRPSEEAVANTTEKTRLALEKLTSGKIAAAQPKNVPNTADKSSFIRYTPQSGQGQQRIIKMTEVAEDPLEPSRFRHKKVPRGPGSPPPPILRSPPRKATAQDQKDWMIPPCVSNWKNNKGYTIPLDKRLAADGRGLQEVAINDKFATFSESLFIADRHAREEVRTRAAMQQKLAERQKEDQELKLRNLAQAAREGRAGSSSALEGSSAAAPRTVAAATGMGDLAGYGSDSEAGGSDASGSTPRGAAPHSDEEDEEDSEEVRERNRMRAERRKEREREMRMSNMGTEQRARVLARCVFQLVIEAISTQADPLFGNDLDFTVPRTETFQRKWLWVWPNPPCRKSPCSTSACSTKSSTLDLLQTTTRTICTTDPSSKDRRQQRPSTSPCRATPRTRATLARKKASSALCRTIVSISASPLKASQELQTRRCAPHNPPFI